MCDESIDAANARRRPATEYAKRSRKPSVHLIDGLPIASTKVNVVTPDGQADAFYAGPTAGKHPAILIWPDVTGLRNAFEQMGRRLAGSGYAVLVVNQYYRWTKVPFLMPGEDWRQPDVRARMAPWHEGLTHEAISRDADALISWLDQQEAVDKTRGAASTGYCIGAKMAMISAASRPDRIRAGASFHGAGLISNKPDSPHNLVRKMNADFLFAIAENDNKRQPDEKDIIIAAFAAANREAEVEVFAGALHGWCPPDNAVYNEEQAEVAWERQLALLKRVL